MRPKELIEFVCTANSGRSPVAQLIARNTLEDMGASRDYEAISSGTHRAVIDAKQFPVRGMIHILHTAIDNGYFPDDAPRQLREAMTAENEPVILEYFPEIVETLEAREIARRAEALKHFGIKGQVKPGHDQTVARDNTVAVLGMTPRHAQAIQDIYTKAGFIPVGTGYGETSIYSKNSSRAKLGTIGAFATGNPEAEMPDAFGKSKAAYFEVIAQLTEQVPLAVTRAVDESRSARL